MSSSISASSNPLLSVAITVTPVGEDRILGATIVGHHAGYLLTEFIAEMKWGKGLKSVMGNIHVYPTLAEANKFAASTWRKKRAQERLLT